MHLSLLLAADFSDIATIVIIIVVGVIRFLYSILKKPDVPQGAPPPPNVPQTPDALQQEIEKFIRQAQGREPRPAPIEKPLVVERPPEPIRQRVPIEERQPPKPREQNRPKPKKQPRPETRVPELPQTSLSKRHVIDDEVRQTLGEGRPQRRGEQPTTASIEQHLKSVFSHKVGSLDNEVDDRSMTSMATTSNKKRTAMKISKEQMRQAIILNEILTRPNFDR
jgi:hypothetical protein